MGLAMDFAVLYFLTPLMFDAHIPDAALIRRIPSSRGAETLAAKLSHVGKAEADHPDAPTGSSSEKSESVFLPPRHTPTD
jgi:hypothetical protein